MVSVISGEGFSGCVVIAVVSASDVVTSYVDSPDREIFSRSGVGGQEEDTLENGKGYAVEARRGNGREGFDLLRIETT